LSTNTFREYNWSYLLNTLFPLDHISSRRQIIAGLGALAALPSTLLSASQHTVSTQVTPAALRPGSTIGIVCPASGVTERDLTSFVGLCTSLGLRVKLGDNVNRRQGYLSASDDRRASEFMRFVEDRSVDAIMCARGGYGVMRILPSLDFRAIRDAGKVIVGFSDITALLIAVEQNAGLVSFHGPVASSTFDSFTSSSFASMLVDGSSGSSESIVDPVSPNATTITRGLAQGRLTGGNLSMIVSTLGTRYEIDTTESILFLEEISEEPYRIDRMLTQLWLAGKLQACKGILLGNFRDCEAKGSSPLQPSVSLRQVIDERIASLGVPAVYGMPFGHVKSKLTLPLGIRAELDATSRQLRFLQPAVV